MNNTTQKQLDGFRVGKSVDGSKTRGEYYIYCRDYYLSDSEFERHAYMHKDGSIHDYCGIENFFYTEEEAEKLLQDIKDAESLKTTKKS